MITFKNLRLVKEMITRLVTYQITIIRLHYYKMIATDLSKQHALDLDLKAIQQISFKGNLNRGRNVNENAAMFFFNEETKKTTLDFSH